MISAILFVSLVLVMVLMFFSFRFIQRLTLRELEISGDILFSEARILALAEIELPIRYVDLDSNEIARKIQKYPLILSARVQKKLNGVLQISMQRARPLVAVLAQTEDSQIPAYFDPEGVCVQVGVETGIVDVPILSGLLLKNPRAGVRLPQTIVSFLAQIAIIKKSNPVLFAKVSEFRLRDHGDDFKVVDIYFTESHQYFTDLLSLDEDRLSRMYYFAKQTKDIERMQRFQSFEILKGVIVGKLIR